MYEPSIADPSTNNGKNDVNLDRKVSILFIDEVVSSGDDIISLSDDDICNAILLLNVYLDP